MLNDASMYEEIALAEALQFTERMFKFYNQELPADFKSTYCEHYLRIKGEKFAAQKKYICVECNNLELLSQL